MADLSILRQAPLDHHSLPARAQADLGGAAFGLGEIRFRGAVNLRARRDDTAARQALEAALGTALPSLGRSATAGGLTVLGLGPDEWLAVGGDGAAAAARLRDRCAGQLVAVTDVTDNYTTLVARGPAARRVLAKGCPLDLHPRASQAGMVAGTVVAKATVVLHLVSDEPAPAGALFHLLVRRSFADYLFRWLEDAGREDGGVVVAG